jgi:hypothetical protein
MTALPFIFHVDGRVSENPDLLKLCSGYGQWHSPNNKRDPQPYLSVTLPHIRAMLDNTPSVIKENAQWVILSKLPSRVHAEQREQGQFVALWADIDDNSAMNAEQVYDRLHALLPSFIAYTSRSATQENQKLRIIVPLTETVSGSTFVRLQKVLNNKLEKVGITPDRVTERAGQVCYMPNKGDFWSWDEKQGALDPTLWADELAVIVKEEKAAQVALQQAREQSRLKAAQFVATGCKSPIDAFNREYPLDLMLRTFGYVQRGKRYVSPNSESGVPGVSITADGIKWISAHGSDRAIGKQTDTGSMGDAFDLFTYYQHGGDHKAAIMAAGEMFAIDGVSITDHNQREYMANKSKEQAFAAFDDISAMFDNADNEQQRADVDLLNPPGLAGDICHLIMLEARRPRPELYPFAALHLMALVGRHRASTYTTKLNLMTLGIAPTAAGKEQAQNTTKRLAKAVKCSNLIHGNAGSFKELVYNQLDGNSASLYAIDEVHSFLGSMKSKNAATYELKMEAEILTMFTSERYTFRGSEKRSLSDLYSRELDGINKRLGKGELTEDEEKKLQRMQKILNQRLEWLEHGMPNPFFSLMGHSVPERLDAFVKADNIDGGFIGRTLVMRCPETREQLRRSKPPADKVAFLEQGIIHDLFEIKSSGLIIAPDKGAAEYLEKAVDWYDDDEQLNDSVVGGIYARAPEHLYRIASILALASGTIKLEHACYAHALVQQSIKDVKHILLKAIVDSGGAKEKLIREHAREVIHRNCKGTGRPLSRLKQIVEKPKSWQNLQKADPTRDYFKELIEWMIDKGELEKTSTGRRERYFSRSVR